MFEDMGYQTNQPGQGMNDYGMWGSNQIAQSSSAGGGGMPNIPTSGILNNSGTVGQSITQGVDSFGASIGFGNVYSAPIGPTLSGAPMASSYTGGGLTATPLSGVLGGAAAGVGIGGLAASLTGGNQTGGMIGGGLGGAGAALLGFTGPVGLAVGGILGGLGGGMFGNKKPPDKTQSGGVNITTGKANPYYAQKQSATGDKFSGQNAGAVSKIEGGIGNFVSWMSSQGATPTSPDAKDRDIIVQVGSRDGLKAWMLGDPQPYRYGNDQVAFSKGVVDLLLKEYQMPDTLRNQILEMADAGQLDNIAAFGHAQGQMQGSVSGIGGSAPLIPGKEDTGAESFSDFSKRYKSTGATSPIRK